MTRPAFARRVLATAVDDVVLALPLAVVALVNVGALRQGRSLAVRLPGRPRVAVPLLVTVPAAVLLAVTEAAGGTPGMRVAGLVVRGRGGAPSMAAAIVRRLVITALPWELAHQAVWSQRAGRGLEAGLLYAASYGTLGLLAVQAARGDGRTVADVLAGTRVEMVRRG